MAARVRVPLNAKRTALTYLGREPPSACKTDWEARGVVPDRARLPHRSNLFKTLSDSIRIHILHALSIIDLRLSVLKDLTALFDPKLPHLLHILGGGYRALLARGSVSVC